MRGSSHLAKKHVALFQQQTCRNIQRQKNQLNQYFSATCTTNQH